MVLARGLGARHGLKGEHRAALRLGDVLRGAHVEIAAVWRLAVPFAPLLRVGAADSVLRSPHFEHALHAHEIRDAPRESPAFFGCPRRPR